MTLGFSNIDFDITKGVETGMNEKKWIGFSTDIQLAEVTYPTTEPTDIDLSDYLPGNESQYDVMLYVLINSSKKADAYLNALATTDIVKQYTSLGATRSQAGTYNSSFGNTVVIPVGLNKTIRLLARTNDSGTITIRLRAYKL